MAKRRRYFARNSVSLAHQLSDAKRSCPGFDGSISLLGLTVEGLVRPTPISVEYMVRVFLPRTGIPKVVVVRPELVGRYGQRIPHRYPDGSLCLYYPPNREWRREFFLSETLIPWAAEWIYFYEIWRVTGNWLGGGIHPSRDQEEE